jgi:hypothetical protein
MTMQPVTDQQGTIVAWMKDSVEIFDPKGDPVGSVQVGFGIHSLDGVFLGYYRNGLFRAKDGRVVAELGHTNVPGSAPPMHNFTLRAPPSGWPPVVAFLNDWSSDWKSVLAVPLSA